MNKLFTKVAALTLGVAMAAGVGVALGSSKKVESAFAGNEYELVKNVSSLSASDNVVIASAATGSVYTMSTTQNTNNRGANGTFDVTNDKITIDSSTQVFTLGKDGNNFTFFTGSGYIYAASSSSNHLKTKSTLDDNCKWSVSISATGAATVVAQGTNTRNILKFNPNNGNPIFAAYNTSGTVAIYKEVTAPVGTQYDVTDSVENGSVSPSKVNEGATLNATILPDAGYDVPETVSVTMAGVAVTNTYENGVVTVENVTGDIVISGSCVAKPAPAHAGTADDPYTVADAILAIDSGITGTKYVTGVVKEIVTPYSTQYSNITFNIVDNPTDTAFIQAFRCGGTDADKVAVGDTVVVSGSIIKYQSKYELDSGCQLVSRTAPVVDTKYTVTFNSNGGTDPEAKEVGEGLVFTFPSAGSKEGYVFKGWTNDNGTTYYQEGDTSAPVNAATTYSGEWQTKGMQSTPYSVADALAAIAANAGIRGVYTTGIVKEIVTPYDSQYSNITFNIVDSANDTDFLQVFRCKGDDASKVAVGDIALVSGNLKLHNSTPEYDANCKLESLVTPKTDWSDAEKTNFAAALDGLVPLFVKTTADPSINTETGFVDYYGEGDVKATYVSYFTQNDWHDDLGGYYSKESPNAHGVITGYVGDATATGTYIMFQYKVYVIVTVVEGEDSTEHKIGSGSNFVLPQPTESSIPAGKQFKAWEVNSVEYDPGDTLEQVTSAVTVVAVYEDIPAPAPTLESIAVSGEYKTKYAYQENFDEEGIVVTAIYSDQSQQSVDLTDVQFSGYDKSVLGEQTVTVTYQEKTTTFKVTVYYTATYKPGEGTPEDGEYVEYIVNPDNYELVSFEQTGFVAPTGKQFKEWSQGTTGKSVQVNGNLSFTAVYEDIPAPAPTNWSADFKETYATCFGAEAPLPAFINAELADDANITWYYPTYKVCIIDVVGNYFDAADDAIYSDTANWSYIGKSKEYAGSYATGYVYEGKDEYTYCTTALYLDNNNELHTRLVFQVIGAITVETAGAKLEYFVGDTLDTTNIIVHYTLVTGEWAEGLNITSYCTFSPTTLDTAGDEIVITVDIAGVYERSYKVKVSEVAMESISISGELSKTEYTEGDAWDATGLVATAHYNNGAEEDVTAQVSWTFQPEETVAGTDSVSVVATLGEISSQAANFDVVVNEPAPAYDADAFAKELLEKVAPICANYDGKKNNKTALKGVWTEMASKYETLSEEEKAKVVEAVAKTDGTDLEKAMAFYNYACKKYGLTKFIAGRQVKAIVNEQVSTGNSILPIIVIVAASVTAVTAIGVVIALKRRKNFLTK